MTIIHHDKKLGWQLTAYKMFVFKCILNIASNSAFSKALARKAFLLKQTSYKGQGQKKNPS